MSKLVGDGLDDCPARYSQRGKGACGFASACSCLYGYLGLSTNEDEVCDQPMLQVDDLDDGTTTFYPSSTFDSNPRDDDERDRMGTREKASWLYRGAGGDSVFHVHPAFKLDNRLRLF